MNAELTAFIRNEIKRQLQIITSGAAGNTTLTTEDIVALFPGMPTITGRPVMHPFGLVSRAPKGTISVTAQQGNHPGARLTLGHRYATPPTVAEGETAIFSRGEYTVKVENGQILVGKGGEYETVVVGETLKTLLISMITAIIAHTHLGNLGVETGPPLNATDFSDLVSQYLSNDKILAKDGGRF